MPSSPASRIGSSRMCDAMDGTDCGSLRAPSDEPNCYASCPFDCARPHSRESAIWHDMAHARLTTSLVREEVGTVCLYTFEQQHCRGIGVPHACHYSTTTRPRQRSACSSCMNDAIDPQQESESTGNLKAPNTRMPCGSDPLVGSLSVEHSVARTSQDATKGT